jgi:Domain of unknown function (DUF5134)
MQSATWMQWVGTALVLAVTVLAGLRLAVASRRPAATDRASDATQVVMGVGMAAMLAPRGNPVPATGWAALFAVVVGGCLVATLREGGLGRRLTWARHAVMGAAIVYLFTAAPMTMSGPTALTWLLVAYFGCCAAWSALTAAGVELRGGAEVATPAGGAPLPAAWMLAPRTSYLCEGVMATSMVWMLLAMR